MERIIFDEGNYFLNDDELQSMLDEEYGDLFAEWYSAPADSFTTEDMEKYLLGEGREEDFKEEIGQLADFFDGHGNSKNETAGNPIIAYGSIGRWDGVSTGFTAFKNLNAVLYGIDSPFKDCEIDKIWDEDGHLHIEGSHHDGSVSVELRQLTEEGIEALWTLENSNDDRDCEKAMSLLRSADSSLALLPRYTEREWGIGYKFA